jgi:hypothetical protein
MISCQGGGLYIFTGGAIGDVSDFLEISELFMPINRFKKKPRSDRIRISLNFTPKRPPHILIREAGYFGKCEEFIKLFNRSCLTLSERRKTVFRRLADLVEKMVLEGYLRQ